MDSKVFIFERLAHILLHVPESAYRLYLLLLKHSNAHGMLHEPIQWKMLNDDYGKSDLKQNYHLLIKEGLIKSRTYLAAEGNEKVTECRILDYLSLIYKGGKVTKADLKTFESIQDAFQLVSDQRKILKESLSNQEQLVKDLKKEVRELKIKLKEKVIVEYNPMFQNLTKSGEKYFKDHPDIEKVWAYAVILGIESVFCKMDKDNQWQFDFALFRKWQKTCPIDKMLDVLFSVLNTGEFDRYIDEAENEEQLASVIRSQLFHKFKNHEAVIKVESPKAAGGKLETQL